MAIYPTWLPMCETSGSREHIYNGGLRVEILLSPLPMTSLCTVYMVLIGSHFNVLFTFSCCRWKLLISLRWTPSHPPTPADPPKGILHLSHSLYNFPMLFMENFIHWEESKESCRNHARVEGITTFCYVSFITCYSICPSLCISINLPLSCGYISE